LFKYFGGKSRVAKRIVSYIPENKTWVEPFAGGASVTLAKPPSEREVLADERSDVTRFFQKVKAGEPIEDLKPDISKREFDIIKNKPENRRSPAEFLALQQKSFGGHGQSFARGSAIIRKQLERYDDYWQRLRKTIILNADFRKTMRKYDSPSTVFYLDPPYPNPRDKFVDYGGHGIPSVQDIRTTIDMAKGKVMLSYPNTPEVRRAFPKSKFQIRKFRLYRPLTSYNAGPRTRSELLILNFRPSERNRWHLLEGIAG